MAGATAAAAVTPAHAQTAQISLINNQLDSNTGNTLSMTVTVGHPFGSVASTLVQQHSSAAALLRINSVINGMHAYRFHGNYVAVLANRNSKFAEVAVSAPTIQKAFALLPFTLTDPNVNAGQANTNADLELEAFNQSATDQTVALLAVFFDTSDNNAPTLSIDSTTGVITGAFTNVGSSDAGVFTVPEPSGLALLALGAGGILARRRRRKAT